MIWSKVIDIKFNLEEHTQKLVGIVYVPYTAKIELKIETDLKEKETREKIIDIKILDVIDKNNDKVYEITTEMIKEIEEVIKDIELNKSQQFDNF